MLDFFDELCYVFVMIHFSAKIDLTQFRKYCIICNRQHPLLFRIRKELQFVEPQKVLSSEFPPFTKFTQVIELSCRNTIGYESYLTKILP